jgi:ankyrin repeat protein
MSGLIEALKNPRGTLEEIYALLDSGEIDLDFQEPETGNTALLTSLINSPEFVALEIIRRGASIGLADAHGETPLMRACEFNLLAVAKEIASQVTDLEVLDNNGRTALAYASCSLSLEMVQMLVRRGASVHTKDRFGRSLFQKAAMLGEIATAEYFLDEFEDLFSVHDRDDQNNQAIHLVAGTGSAISARWLVGRGAEVDGIGHNGWTPLIFSSFYGKVEVARVLVQAGAKITRTTLVWAAYNGQSLMVQELLMRGADPSGVRVTRLSRFFFLCANNNVNPPETARQAANRRGHGEVVRLLDAWGSIRAVWAMGSAEQVRRVGKKSALKRIPKDLVRMVWSVLV